MNMFGSILDPFGSGLAQQQNNALAQAQQQANAYAAQCHNIYYSDEKTKEQLQYEEELKLREDNEAVKEAWEQYQFILTLCRKGENI
jgi:hypothetical protein